MNRIVMKAPAKINLALDIVGLDERGYHLLEMVMQTVSVYDTVTLQKREESGIFLSCDDPAIPCNPVNICWKCAEAFFSFVGIAEYGIEIQIEKNIPQQAGMAGGSADGAAVLVGLNRIYETGLSTETLCAIGKKIGADIPFCIVGGTAKVEGIGEIITPLSGMPDSAIVIAKPRSGISTQKAFADFDKMDCPPKLKLQEMIASMEEKDLVKMCGYLYNALELVCPVQDVKNIKHSMMGCGAKGALMTGSGSAVFGIFADRKRAYDCERKLADRYENTYLCNPVAHGVFAEQEEHLQCGKTACGGGTTCGGEKINSSV